MLNSAMSAEGGRGAVTTTLMRILAGIVLGLWLASPTAAQEVLYGATAGTTTTSNLYRISPADGSVVATIGPIGYAVTGLAIHPVTGVLYGSTSNQSAASPGSLITINRFTGAGTLVGSYGFPSQTMADLTFTSDGRLYGWLVNGAKSLFTINLATGAATLVGPSGIVGPTPGSGLAASATDVLYYAGSGANGALRTINRATGAPTTVATLTGSFGSIAALAFNSAGVLYGAYGPPVPPTRLVTINTSTGVVTDLGPTIDDLDAIVFASAPVAAAAAAVPALGWWGLLVLSCLISGAVLLMKRLT